MWGGGILCVIKVGRSQGAILNLVLTNVSKGDIMEMPNKLNIQSMGVFSFYRDIYTLFCQYLHCDEFDKMQIPYAVRVYHIPNLYIVCLATTGVCVFVRWLRSAHFFIFIKGERKNEKSSIGIDVGFYTFFADARSMRYEQYYRCSSG